MAFFDIETEILKREAYIISLDQEVTEREDVTASMHKGPINSIVV